MKRLILLSLSCLIIGASIANAQGSKKEFNPLDRPNAYFIWPTFSFDWPQQDLADRFGVSNTMGLHLEHFWGGRQIFAGVQGHYGFGSEVYEDVLSNLRTPSGDIIGNNGTIASVFLRERYWYTGAYAGKTFGFIGQEQRSGLRLAVGGGVWQHWIRVQDDTNSAAQIAGDYVRGYDRMTNGPAVYASVGYQHFSSNGLINLHVSFEVLKGFLTHRRAWNFAENTPGGEEREDMLMGIRVAWALPFFYGGEQEVIFY